MSFIYNVWLVWSKDQPHVDDNGWQLQVIKVLISHTNVKLKYFKYLFWYDGFIDGSYIENRKKQKKCKTYIQALVSNGFEPMIRHLM